MLDNQYKKTSEVKTVYYLINVVNQKTKSRFFASIPAKRTYYSMGPGGYMVDEKVSEEKARQYISSEEFVNQEDNEFWKQALEKWGLDCMSVSVDPFCYDTEEKLFDSVDKIIDRIHKYGDFNCYNCEFFEDEAVDWDEIRRKGKEYAENLAKSRAATKRGAGQPKKVFIVKNRNTSEEVRLSSTKEIATFLKVSNETLYKFINHQKSKLDKEWILTEEEK